MKLRLLFATLRAAFSLWPQAAVSDREKLFLGLGRWAWSRINEDFGRLIELRTPYHLLGTKEPAHWRENVVSSDRNPCESRK